MARGGTRPLVQSSISKSDFAEVELKIAELMLVATNEVSREVASKVMSLIDASGNVPYLTGALRAESHLSKDKYKEGASIMGWTLPYARVRYFGVHGVKEWTTVDGKRKTVTTTKTGVPFWDREFTRNVPLMVSLFSEAARKVFK